MPCTGFCSCWGSRVLPLLLAYISYLLLGATVFQLLEKQAEAQSRDQFQFEKLRFLENYTCLDQQALEQFVQVIMEAWVKGVNPKGNSTNPSNWDFGSSFFFAGTVVTTIGYGNLAPSTEAGQVFCVFYALVGIPLNVIFLNHLGTGLRAHLVTLERWEDQPRRSQLLQVLGLALFLALGTLAVLIFPPMVFSHVEGWSFGEGFYFAFITLSTIGFGDYVVGTDPSKHYISIYRSLAAVWILLGLAWLALILPLGPLLLHRCSQLWLLGRGLGLKARASTGAPGLSRPQKTPISLSAPRVKTGQRGLPCARWRSDRGECPSPAPAPAPSSHVPAAASAGGAPGQGPGLRGARHRAPATRLPGVPGSGHQCVLGAGGPRGAGIRPRLPARQVGAAAELHVPGRPGAGLADPGHHPSVQGRCPPPRQHHQHGALGACGLLLLFRVHSHHHWLWQPEPPHQSGPPLLHPLRSCGDPTPPRGTQPPGAPHAAGRARLRPQDGGRLAGPHQGSLAGGLQRPALGPPAVPAAAAAALLAHGGLELRGGLLLRLHHPQHRGLRRLRDWDEPLQDLSAVVQEHGVLVDPLWAGVAGLDHQTRPLAAGDPKGHMFLLPPWLQGPELEAGPGWRARVLLPTARLLSGEACGPHRVPGSLSSGCRLWQGWLVVHSIISNFLLPNKTPDLGLGT